MLDRHVVVLHALGLALGAVEHLGERTRDAHVTRRAASADPRAPLERALDVGAERVDVDAGARQQAWREPVALLEQREQQVVGVDLRVAVAQRRCLGLVQRLLRLLGQPARVHDYLGS